MAKKKSGKRRKVILLAVILLAAGIGGYALYGSYKLTQLSTMTFAEMLAYTTKDNKDAVITVGIIQDGSMTYNVYGEDGLRLAPEEHTYEIGSVTKTFTTSLLAKAMNEGSINLDDPIDQYLSLPQQSYYPTIRRLVTHTSGYKEYYFEKTMISNYFRQENAYHGITQAMLLESIGKINLKDSDYPFKYSNFGIATLGAVLEQVYKKDYPSLMNAYILDDLGLVHTKVADGSGDLGNYWDWSETDAYLPTGAILSTITDMLEYVNMHMNGQTAYLSQAHEVLTDVETTSAMYEKMGIRMDAIGMGWMIDQENNLIWHNGATGNYNSYVGFDKEHQIGVVILSNLSPDDKIPATVMGIELLTSLQGE